MGQELGCSDCLDEDDNSQEFDVQSPRPHAHQQNLTYLTTDSCVTWWTDGEQEDEDSRADSESTEGIFSSASKSRGLDRICSIVEIYDPNKSHLRFSIKPMMIDQGIQTDNELCHCKMHDCKKNAVNQQQEDRKQIELSYGHSASESTSELLEPAPTDNVPHSPMSIPTPCTSSTTPSTHSPSRTGYSLDLKCRLSIIPHSETTPIDDLDEDPIDRSRSHSVSLAMSVSGTVDVELAEESKTVEFSDSSLSLPPPPPQAMSRRKTWVHPYCSEQEMLDNESISKLVAKRAICQNVLDILGDPTLYQLPTTNPTLFHIERDLRKIKVSLLDLNETPEDANQRRFAKMVILKHYNLLTSIYQRYCKIGGDTEWMTISGWTSLLTDCGLIDDAALDRGVHDNHSGHHRKYSGHHHKKYVDIFRRVYSYHQHYLHSKRNCHTKKVSLSDLYGDMPLNDKDPWTGQWILQKDRRRVLRKEKRMRSQCGLKDRAPFGSRSRAKTVGNIASDDSNQSVLHNIDQFKLRKIGDLKIIGCHNSMENAVIAGSLNENNYTVAGLEIAHKPQQRLRVTEMKSRRTWKCTIRPPRSLMDPITMDVEWKEANSGSSAVKTGSFQLFKHCGLDDNDDDVPLSRYVGLSRHEFFDALLCIARISEVDSDATTKHAKQQELFRLMDKLAMAHLNAFLFQNIVALDHVINVQNGEINRRIKTKLNAQNTTLMKLFRKYASLDECHGTFQEHCQLAQDQWCAMAVELCDAAERYQRARWKLGGRPTMSEIIQCFMLCKQDQMLMDDEITFVAFQRCLLYFAGSIYRHRFNAKYVVLPITKRVDLVLKWCRKLNNQKVKMSYGIIQSDSFRKISKRKRKIRSAGNMVESTTHNASPRLKNLRCSSLLRLSV